VGARALYYASCSVSCGRDQGGQAIDKIKVTISWRLQDGEGVEWDSNY
jgi:hypothetical protein